MSRIMNTKKNLTANLELNKSLDISKESKATKRKPGSIAKEMIIYLTT